MHVEAWLSQLQQQWPDRSDFPEQLVLASGALAEAARYIAGKGWQHPLLVVDANTHEAAGRQLVKSLAEAGMRMSVTRVLPNAIGDVVADEASVVQVLLDVQSQEADVLVAIGAGTLHDIVRYASFTTDRPFVSVPTAPSVDGFTSKGAPLIIRQEKRTVPCQGPVALFADTDVLKQAPRPLIAAGFGDMLGKATSLFDWQIGRKYAGEPYMQEVADMTRQALDRCIQQVKAIGAGTAAGVTALMQSLLESGLAMLIFGQSHPASGAEHHLSHYWEMVFHRQRRHQLLHGAKVGVACGIVADLYHDIGREKPELASLLTELPTGDDIRRLLAEAGGPTSPEKLGIDAELMRMSLDEAHLVRPNRTTLLRLRNEGRLG